jgi:nitrite reductase/ring-hydroxylating ferredoxin subunit
VAREVHVGRLADLAAFDRRLVRVGDTEIGIFQVGDGYVAYENRCPHQGGPACLGLVVPKIDAVYDEPGTSFDEQFSESTRHVACPWHGWEFDLGNGVCVADPEFRLNSFPVVTRDDEVYVVV